MATQFVHNRMHRLERMTLQQLRALDRSKTVVILPVGMIEEHGNHLPLGTDTYAVEAIALAAAAWLLEHQPDLHILLMPLIPFGTDPVDLRRPDLFAQAGSVWVSRDTLKAVIADLAGHMIRYGFYQIFPLGFHGGKDQSIVLAEVCDELRAAYDGLVMYEPMSYVRAGAEEDMIPGLATLLGRPLEPQEEVALKSSIHASMMETSMMLYLRPELVDLKYTTLRSLEWNQIYKMEDWPGYVGAGPVHANSEIGAAVLRWWGVRVGQLIRRALRGTDLTELSRHPQWYFDGPPQSEIEIPNNTANEMTEPEIDSKPAMMFSAEDVQRHLREAGEAGQEVSDETPPSSLMNTKHHLHRPSSEQDDEQ